MGARPPEGSAGPVWRNWARTQSATPRVVARPRDLDDLVRTVASTTDRGGRLRAVGSGHSFTGAAVTDDGGRRGRAESKAHLILAHPGLNRLQVGILE